MPLRRNAGVSAGGKAATIWPTAHHVAARREAFGQGRTGQIL